MPIQVKDDPLSTRNNVMIEDARATMDADKDNIKEDDEKIMFI